METDSIVAGIIGLITAIVGGGFGWLKLKARANIARDDRKTENNKLMLTILDERFAAVHTALGSAKEEVKTEVQGINEKVDILGRSVTEFMEKTESKFEEIDSKLKTNNALRGGV